MVADVQLKCAGSSTDRDLAAKVALRQDPHQWHLVFSHFFFTNAIPLGFYGGVCEMVHCLYFKWSLLILWFRRRNSNCKIFSLVMYLSMSRYPDMGIFIFFHKSSFAVLDQLHDDATMDLGCCHLDLWSAFSQHLHLSPLWTTSICLLIQSELISVLSDGM